MYSLTVMAFPKLRAVFIELYVNVEEILVAKMLINSFIIFFFLIAYLAITSLYKIFSNTSFIYSLSFTI